MFYVMNTKTGRVHRVSCLFRPNRAAWRGLGVFVDMVVATHEALVSYGNGDQDAGVRPIACRACLAREELETE